MLRGDVMSEIPLKCTILWTFIHNFGYKGIKHTLLEGRVRDSRLKREVKVL